MTATHTLVPRVALDRHAKDNLKVFRDEFLVPVLGEERVKQLDMAEIHTLCCVHATAKPEHRAEVIRAVVKSFA